MKWPVPSRYSKAVLAFLCLFLADIKSVLADIPVYYMDDYCARTIDMGQARLSAGRIFLRRPEEGLRFLDCTVYIKAPSNKRLSFKFHDFNILSPQGCYNNNIRLYEDTRLQLPITDRLCNTNKVPDRAYVTSGEDATIWLDKENFLNDQIDLVFTAFTFAPCRGGEYQCKNDHCIASNLYCNGLDNCGDESDNCLLRPGTIIAIVIAVACIVVVIAIIVAIYLYRRQRKIRRERVSG